MKAVIRYASQWGLICLFLVWGCILMVVIFGEDNPNQPLPIVEFFGIKLMGIGSAYATYKAAVWCYVRDMFPALVRKYMEECDKMEDEL